MSVKRGNWAQTLLVEPYPCCWILPLGPANFLFMWCCHRWVSARCNHTASKIKGQQNLECSENCCHVHPYSPGCFLRVQHERCTSWIVPEICENTGTPQWKYNCTQIAPLLTEYCMVLLDWGLAWGVGVVLQYYNSTVCQSTESKI